MEKVHLTLSAEAVEVVILSLAAKVTALEYNNQYLREAAENAEAKKKEATIYE